MIRIFHVGEGTRVLDKRMPLFSSLLEINTSPYDNCFVRVNMPWPKNESQRGRKPLGIFSQVIIHSSLILFHSPSYVDRCGSILKILTTHGKITSRSLDLVSRNYWLFTTDHAIIFFGGLCWLVIVIVTYNWFAIEIEREWPPCTIDRSGIDN